MTESEFNCVAPKIDACNPHDPAQDKILDNLHVNPMT